MADARHHHSCEVVFVAVPFEAGSPKHAREVKPRYPQHNRREAWRPRTRPPSKAERLIDFMRNMAEQEAELRKALKPNAALFAAWRRGEVTSLERMRADAS